MTDGLETPSSVEWDDVQGEITCPFCEYNLRGLQESRCPECGARFVWAEVLDPTRRTHPYIFEHHSEKNLRSFLSTFFCAMIPYRFWSTLHPNHCLKVKRLWLYFLVVLIPALLLPTLFTLGSEVLVMASQNAKNRDSFMRRYAQGDTYLYEDRAIQRLGSVEAYMARAYGSDLKKFFVAAVNYNRKMFQSLYTLTSISFAPLATLVAFLLFRRTLGKARLNSNHILRAVAYNSGVFLASGILIGCVSLMSEPNARFSARLNYDLMMAVGAISLVMFSVFLLIASTRYLRFKRAFAVMFSTQVIVYLVVGNVWLLVEIWGR